MTKARQILVVGPSWVGDMVMAQVLFKVLRQHHDDCQIDVLAPSWSTALTQYMPEVRAVITAPFNHGKLNLRRRYRLATSLRRTGYDQAIVLPNSFKSALIPYWAKIPLRTGYAGEQRYHLINDRRQLDKQTLSKTIDRFAALGVSVDSSIVQSLPQPRLEITTEDVTAHLEQLKLNRPQQPLLVLCPGAEFGTSKQWPAQHYATVARHYLDQRWSVWLLGSANDRQTADDINQLLDNEAINLCGDTSLSQAMTLMSLADRAISNDSGLMHVAAALSKPQVAIYGSSDPGFTPPLNSQAKVAQLGLDCSPCFKRECPLGHHNCMNKLTPNVVLELCAQLPSVSAGVKH